MVLWFFVNVGPECWALVSLGSQERLAVDELTDDPRLSESKELKLAQILQASW